MIRSVIAFFLFAVVVCAAIIFRSDNGTGPPVAGQPAASPAPAPQAATPAAPTTEVTRAEVASMVLPAASSRIAVPGQIQAEPTIRTDTHLSMEDMTNNVLAELGLLPESASTLPQQATARAATATVLRGLNAATGGQSAVQERVDLQSLVVDALKAGQDDATIDQLVNAAAIGGQVAVPEVLVTADGRVDTSVLLANIITQAKVAAGQTAPPTRPDSITDARGVEVRLVQAAQGATEARFYTVQRGDSLGAIAIKFYGNVNQYPRIFEANRQTLSSPDRIRIGQRLVIPDL